MATTRSRPALRCSLGLALLLLWLAPVHAPAQTGEPAHEVPEYVLKAGFLYNFAKYVEWPADAFATRQSPISIGVVGTDPFGAELERTLEDKSVDGRRFEIRRYRDIADIQPVHILFVPGSQRERIDAILRQVRRLPVLTVGEDQGFPRGGGVVAILIENRRPVLEINAAAASAQNLAIDSKLLKVARIVKENPPR